MAKIGHAAILGGLWGLVIHGVLDFRLTDPEYWILALFGVGIIITLTDIKYDKKEN